MQLTINQNVIGLLKNAGFYPDTMITALTAIFALEEGEIKLLDVIDDNSSSQRAVLVYYDLVRKGLWNETPEGKTFFVSTEEGKKFYSLLKNAMIGIQQETKSPVGDVEDWFPSWFDLWPKGVRTMGKLIRSDEKGCLKKMKQFVKDYPHFTPATIISATQSYLENKASEGWKGVRCATYFISHKDSGSDLAAECDEYVNSDEVKISSDNSNFFI
jgi:hypothetical protein